MKTVGDKLESFEIVGIKPGFLEDTVDGSSAFEKLTEKSFDGKWKVIFFYPKNFTFVCPSEIVAYDKLRSEFQNRDAVLLGGNTDNEYTHLAWRRHHPDLKQTEHWSFADTRRDQLSLANQLGILHDTGVALRATFIVDPQNVIQHVTVNNLDVGRNSEESVRVLDALQSGALCACDRQVGGSTL